MELKRYEIGATYGLLIVASDFGEWVRYDEAHAEIERLKKRIEELETSQDARRKSIVQELGEGLKIRGLWAGNGADSDLITAIFLAIDRKGETNAKADA